MKSVSVPFKVLIALLCALLMSAASFAKEKEKANSTQKVDSGSFGVFRSGTRVATETFSIEQSPQGSVISSEFKSSLGEQVAEQSSELQLTPSADIRRYEWKETNPEKIQITVTPNDPFLVEHFMGSDSKTPDQSYLLPASTSILDDYFFVQREVLLWRYLASVCKRENGPLSCPRQKVQFGALNPHARSSLSVGIEFSGREKLTLHGTQQEYSKFLLTSEAGDWALWMNDQLKVVRLVNDTGTEIIRD